jgi:hypothetical protein
LSDHWKRKSLLPVYLLLLPFAWLCSRALYLRNPDVALRERNRELLAHAFSLPLLFGRSLVLVLRRAS